MDFNESGSEQGGSPTSILKKQKDKKKELLPCIVVHNKPFKLRFAEKQDIGRSYVSLVKPLGLNSTVASKFYAKQYKNEVSENDVERAFEKINKMYNGPREKYNTPILDSHNYGWHHDTKFDKIPRNDRRFYHGIRDSHLVKSQVLIMSTDKKTGK